MIAAMRTTVAELVRGAVPDLAVHQWLPEDVPEVPCVVVGRPLITPDPDAPVAALATIPVTVVGRRYTADAAQAELDDATWAVLAAFNWLRGMHTADVQRLNVTTVEPDLVSIAGDEYPVYRISVDAHLIAC